MRLMLQVLLPLAAMAATGIPTDPARAASTPCPRAATAAPAEKTASQPKRAVTKKAWRKLEAL